MREYEYRQLHQGMTHRDYLDEPHDVINRELRIKRLLHERQQSGRQPPRPPEQNGPPSIT